MYTAAYCIGFGVRVEFCVYGNSVVFVERGWQKHYLYFDNCDNVNGLIYFSLVMFDDAEIGITCDIEFWKEWLDFYCSTFGITKNIKFIGGRTDIIKDKIIRRSSIPNLMFSGGKDSTLSRYLLTDPHLMIFRSQHYKVGDYVAEEFSTNIDNELYHCVKSLRGKLPIEMFFPLINKYANTYMGIEKETWENPINLLSIDVKAYSELLYKYGLILDSPIKDLYSFDILDKLVSGGIDFVRCGDSDFCYNDESCLTYFIMGCDKEHHSFDRDKYLIMHPKLKEHKDIRRTVEAIVSSKMHKEYFNKLIDNHWKGI